MPIFMDLHIVPGVNAKDVADAHSMDVLMEKEHNCKCLTYWIDELRGHVFCLIDAPDKESVIELHNRAHGLAPHKIIEVEPGLVHSFLGRITDPENAQLTENGLIILDDTSFRVLMSMRITDPALLQEQFPAEEVKELSNRFFTTARNEILRQNGREVQKEANLLVASFVSGEKAFTAALAVQQELQELDQLGLCISIHAGEPVMQTDKLFGDTLQMLKQMLFLKREKSIRITTGVKELLNSGLILNHAVQVLVLTPDEEAFLNLLFQTLQEHYSDETFDVESCCSNMAMSKSQLYRKTVTLCGLSPNNLLREYRLDKAAELIRTSNRSLSQISFDTGFTSASYFTKCFKQKFGVLPMNYLQNHQQAGA